MRQVFPQPPLRPARRRWKGVQRDESLWRCLRKTARRAGGSNGKIQRSRIYILFIVWTFHGLSAEKHEKGLTSV